MPASTLHGLHGLREFLVLVPVLVEVAIAVAATYLRVVWTRGRRP